MCSSFKLMNIITILLVPVSALINTMSCLQLKHIPPYGFLYYKQLQSLFRQCGQVKSIVFDGSK